MNQTVKVRNISKALLPITLSPSKSLYFLAGETKEIDASYLNLFAVKIAISAKKLKVVSTMASAKPKVSKKEERKKKK